MALGDQYNNAREDLTVVIAQMTSGIEGALPEQDDYELAGDVVEVIEDMIEAFHNV